MYLDYSKVLQNEDYRTGGKERDFHYTEVNKIVCIEYLLCFFHTENDRYQNCHNLKMR